MTQHIARFVPQAWVGGTAIEVDHFDDGREYEWPVNLRRDCSDWYKQQLLDEIAADGEAHDIHDIFQHHGSPTWVRQWSGPFEIYIREAS